MADVCILFAVKDYMQAPWITLELRSSLQQTHLLEELVLTHAKVIL